MNIRFPYHKYWELEVEVEIDMNARELIRC